MQNHPPKMSLPKAMLQIEGGALLAVSILLYAYLGANGWVYIALFFIFDVFMLGYLKDVRLGSLIYNLGHTQTLPMALALLAFMASTEPLLGFSLIWLGHIGLDRLVGYGLKYPTFFKDTHLQRV